MVKLFDCTTNKTSCAVGLLKVAHHKPVPKSLFLLKPSAGQYVYDKKNIWSTLK